jgi:hypothetical protein
MHTEIIIKAVKTNTDRTTMLRHPFPKRASDSSMMPTIRAAFVIRLLTFVCNQQ